MSEENTVHLNPIAKSPRNKSIELLRIVLMLLIIITHVRVGTEFSGFSVNSAVHFVFRIGNVATNAFILITGFYSIRQSRYSYKKILRLILEVTFYQIILNTASLLCGNSKFSLDFLLGTLFPIFFGGGYWFIVRYIQLYLLIPLINAGLKSIGKRAHLSLVVIFGILFSVFPMVIGKIVTVQDFQFNQLTWFVWLYALGAYWGLYGSVFFKKKKTAGFLLLGCAAVYIPFRVLNNYYSYQAEMPSEFIQKVLHKAATLFGSDSRNAILIVAMSVLIFIVFQNLTIRLPDQIYPVAGSVFGIYLLHNNLEFRDVLWVSICKVPSMADSPWYPLYALGCVIAVFAVCCAIDMLVRKFLFKPLYRKINL